MPKTFAEWLPGQVKRTTVLSLKDASGKMKERKRFGRPVVRTDRSDAEIDAAVATMRSVCGPAR